MNQKNVSLRAYRILNILQQPFNVVGSFRPLDLNVKKWVNFIQ